MISWFLLKVFADVDLEFTSLWAGSTEPVLVSHGFFVEC